MANELKADVVGDPNFLLSTMDAKIWADEFCKRNIAADHATILGWFACAIMTGFDEATRRAERATLVGTIDVSSEGADGIDWKDIEPGLYRVMTIPAPSAT